MMTHRRVSAAEVAETKRRNELVLSRIGVAADRMRVELERLEQVLDEERCDDDDDSNGG